MSKVVREWAPIALFIYKRPEHARQTISSLQACGGYAESPIFVFADGPAHPRDRLAVQETRAVARTLLGDRATFLERETNLGVDRSVVSGVTELCDRYDKVIVVEDDLVVSPLFLRFLNDGLGRYEEDPRVMQVAGHMFDVPQLRRQSEALFLPLTTSWGWATWKRAWDQFDATADGWQAHLADDQVRRRFDLDGNVAYSTMLAHQMRRDVGAWDIRWYYTVFSRGGLALFPPRTLVINVGFDGSGTHDRLALPSRQARLETSVTFDLPGQVTVSLDKGHVFEAAGRFRATSVPRKAIGAAKFVLRGVGRPSAAGWMQRRRNLNATDRGDGTPNGGGR